MASQGNQAGGQVNEPIPVGTRLENYRIVRLLASGGFSFVYLAHDENEAPVAIKEYLPSTLALRANGESYPRIPEQDLATFRVGMKSFCEEGRALAGLSHPNIVRVLNFFRANETVYLVMRYERGRTLHDHIGRRRGALKEPWIRATFAQLLNGLREVHSNKLLHLDIKPSNVYLRTDGTPVLLDFGAARQAFPAEGMKLPQTFTPGFASPEQHVDRELLGPWSDIYSVGATMYACLGNARPKLADPARFLSRTMAAAHEAVVRHTEKLQLSDMPRTVLVACVVQDGYAHWSNVGDCRFYLLREGRVIARTRDDTLVQLLVDEGRIREEAIASHPERNRLLQTLGGYQAPRPAGASARLAKDDVLLLCSDGFWGPLTQRQLLHGFIANPLGQAIPDLMALAEMRAGDECDNLSVVALAWGEDEVAAADAAQTVPQREPATDVQDFTATDLDFLRMSDEDIERAIAEIRAALRKNAPR